MTDLNSFTMRVFNKVQELYNQNEIASHVYDDLVATIKGTPADFEYKAPPCTPEERRSLTARMLRCYGASNESVMIQLRKIEPVLSDDQLQEVIDAADALLKTQLRSPLSENRPSNRY